MRALGLPESGRPLRVAFLGAHPDDIEIGCFGVIETLLRSGRTLDLRWAVLSGVSARRTEAQRSAEALIGEAPSEILLEDFGDGFFPEEWGGIKRWMRRFREGFSPDVVFTHYRDDRHQDHRIVAELTWNHFRDALILEYEVPKYDGELGSPNAFVALAESTCRRKSEHLLRFFPSQSDRPWFTEETFRGLARLRGVEAGAGSGYAEAFHARKLLLLE